VAYIFLIRVVKEELIDDEANLPNFNGRVVSWVNICRFQRGIFLVAHRILYSSCCIYCCENFFGHLNDDDVDDD